MENNSNQIAKLDNRKALM